MRSLFYIITILVVGTACASFFAFYRSPNKTVALLGEPQLQEVAGAQSQKTPALLPNEIPTFNPSEIISYSKSLQSSQMTLKTSSPLSSVAAFYNQNLASNGWQKKADNRDLDSEAMKFTKGNKTLNIRISTSSDTGETIITLFYLLASTN